MNAEPLSFPPLMQGAAVGAGGDPFTAACAEARQGCDAGMIFHAIGPQMLEAAIVFAPDVPLRQAAAMLPLCAVGFQNALGALAPPEIAVHLGWEGGIVVNGASCGAMQMAASDRDPKAEPDWLVVGLRVRFWPQSDETGLTPDETALYAEGCAEIAPTQLLESWARHTLNWINRWEEGGAAELHREWRGLAQNMGEEVAVLGRTGTFIGVDEDFGLLLRDGDTTTLLPLTDLLREDV